MAATQPDAIALLKADHRMVEDLFEQFEKARSDNRKGALAKEICTELIIHSTIEEEIFYPALRGKIEDDLLDEAYVEHDGAKMLIAEILGSAPGMDFYDAKVTVLSEEINHHVKEEERPGEGMFAQARATGADMQALGDAMAARKEALKAEIQANGLPTPMTRSMQGVRLERGVPVEA
jgi:hypothetical protein